MARQSKKGSRASNAKAPKAKRAKGRKGTKKAKRRIARPGVIRHKDHSVSDLQAQRDRYFNELKEARELRSATAEILKIIASSPDDVQPAFEAIATSANRLLSGFSTAVFRFLNGVVYLEAFTPTAPSADKLLRAAFPNPLAEFQPFELARRGKPVQIPDIEELPDSQIKNVARARGFRSMLFSPLMNNDVPIGLISVTRLRTGSYAHHHVELLQTFADQAVIAIENARLFNETKEALAHQTATADVLKIISRSAFELEPVLDALLSSACRLCEGDFGTIRYRVADNDFRLAATFGCLPEWKEHFSTYSTRADRSSLFGRTIIEGRTIHLPDVLADPDFGRPEAQRLIGFRAALSVPLVREGKAFGVINLFRFKTGPFESRQIGLLQTFADQAVIAIENARLFNEVQTKTRDLSEALNYQMASGNILGVIASSPSDVGPALQAIVESACRLCDAYDAGVLLKVGNELHFSAHHGPIPTGQHPRPLSREWVAGRSVVDKLPVQVSDFWSAEAAEFPEGQRQSHEQGHRCTLSVPLLREGETLGALALRRLEPVAFSPKQVAQLQTFADQAVIAIENARLFNETKEALERQTATADILGVIASSPSDVKPVFEAIAARAKSLLGGFSSTVFRFIDGVAHLQAFTPTSPEADQILKSTFPRPAKDFAPFRMTQAGEVMQIPDTEALTDEILDISRARGFRSMIFAPLMNKGISIGFIAVTRILPGDFTDHHVQLLRTFADQAVIAVENARLFDEVQARTRDLTEALRYQTGSSNILSVIASSPTDVGPALKAIVESACELCDAYDAVVILKNGDELTVAAHQGSIPLNRVRWVNDRTTVSGRAIIDQLPVHLHDVASEEGMEMRTAQEMSRRDGGRTVLGIPLLREGESIGAIVLRRTEVYPFSDKQIALLQTFADQAVIAIGNVLLFDEVQARTRELATSLDDLRTAQDRLVQTEKLASLGQLTAGIAHEIKNPLNFVNNFSALSAELIEELDETLARAPLDQQMRGELDELTETLKSNLEKVVQHGNRADSIVKNMLLHSRQGAGEHRSADINALVEESLNLAYHGARAEKPGFNITLKRDLDPEAGAVELYPQEITRALLNLISNGFYAATKRKSEEVSETFEPTLSATTKNLGPTVEIRIRDNGPGIPLEVRRKMFNPFFTTKSAGEGTGLGLSMTHDIIVKQHGGSIDVATELGQFTEFTIVLPRRSNVSGRDRGEP